MKLTFALATACALLSAPAFAQSQTPSQPQPSSQTSGVAPATAPISTADFVNRVLMSDMFYTRAAKMAQQKGDDTEQNFARQVVIDHTKAMNALKTMVNTGKADADVPTTLDCEHQQKLTELQNLWGQSFDDAYSRDLLQSDQNQINLFEHYAQNGDNVTLRQWATKMLPEVKSHLAYAQTLSSEVHPGPAREEWQYDGAVGSS